MGEMVNGLPVAVLVVLGAGLVLFVILFLARFGKALAKVALVICGLLLAGAVAVLALSSQATATPTAATSANVGQAATSAGAMLCTGGLGALALISTGAAGLFYARLRLAERWPTRSSQLNCHWPRRQRQPDGPVVYIIQNDHADVEALDLWEVDEWTREESLQLWH